MLEHPAQERKNIQSFLKNDCCIFIKKTSLW